MRKKIKGLIVICVLLCLVFAATSCGFLNKSDNISEAQKENEKVNALTSILEKMQRRVPNDSDAHYVKLQYTYSTLVNIGEVNYQINYKWKDVNLDVLNYSQYENLFNGKEDIEQNIALSETQGYDWYVSQLNGYSYENSEIALKLGSISEISEDYKIFYNEGHEGLTEENEVIIPKWLYFKLYCTTLEEVSCDIETVERVLADNSILQRDMFLGLTNDWGSRGAFSAFDSLAISLGYYGIIDTSSPKADMKLIMKEKPSFITGYSDNTYELSVVGYFETEIDRYFDKPMAKDMYDYGELNQYLFCNTWTYFK